MMKQSFKYSEHLIKKAIEFQSGIDGVSLDDNDKIENTVKSIIRIVSLEDVLEVIEPKLDLYNDVLFTLRAKEGISGDEFTRSIKKFGDYIASKGDGKQATVIVKEIENFINNLDINENQKIQIGSTSLSDDNAKVHFDLPKNWIFFENVDQFVQIEVVNYFKRKGISAYKDGWDRNLYALTKEDDNIKKKKGWLSRLFKK